jgi:hypothetical protein
MISSLKQRYWLEHFRGIRRPAYSSSKGCFFC